MGKSKIEWTESTWNPVIGCTKVSTGCTNCYAERMAARLGNMGVPGYCDDVVEFDEANDKHLPKWTGEIIMIPSKLDKPLHWRKPRRIFVCSMSDLFHEKVPFEFIDKVFTTMALCPQHIFQVLTKRADRMAEYLDGSRRATGTRIMTESGLRGREYSIHGWPLRNIHIGVTCENQKTADERIPILLQIPAAVRFVSIEPMLGPVDLRCIIGDPRRRCVYDCLRGQVAVHNNVVKDPVCGSIDWVIVGGESGPGARPMHPDWVRSIRDQCVAADVPFFFKQWGEFVAPGQSGPLQGGLPSPSCKLKKHVFPSDGCFSKIVYRVGKKKAGCLLDGKEWKQYPK